MYYRAGSLIAKHTGLALSILIAGAFFAFGAAASCVDEEEYEGNTMTFVLKKPTWRDAPLFEGDGITFEKRVRYSYQVIDLTARYREDYEVAGGRRGKVVFPEGQSATTEFKVVLHEDDVDEGDGEKFKLVLTAPQREAARDMYLYGNGLPTEITCTGLILEPE